LQELRVTQKEITARLDKESDYEKFLEKVVHSEPSYSDPLDILKRHETLAETHDDLQRKIDRVQAEYDELRSEKDRVIKIKEYQRLQRTVAIAETQKKKEQAEERTKELYDSRERARAEERDRDQELGESLLACENLFKRVMQQHAVFKKLDYSADAESDDVMVKLKTIDMIIMDFKAISEDPDIRQMAPPATQLALPMHTSQQPTAQSATAPAGQKAAGDAMATRSSESPSDSSGAIARKGR